MKHVGRFYQVQMYNPARLLAPWMSTPVSYAPCAPPTFTSFYFVAHVYVASRDRFVALGVRAVVARMVAAMQFP
jgi:hypothetical protein